MGIALDILKNNQVQGVTKKSSYKIQRIFMQTSAIIRNEKDIYRGTNVLRRTFIRILTSLAKNDKTNYAI